MNKIMSRTRLLPILKDFGEYPIKYRQTIWKTIMRLPQNSRAFLALLRKQHQITGTNHHQLHPCVANYDTQFPLYNQKILRNLKKIISCLAYWSNLFAHLTFLPTFIFPFLQLWIHDSVCSFEIIATILLNQCQLWFEFSPLEPFNYLGIIENILSHFDNELLQHFIACKVSVHTYAWQLLQNGLSEVLDQGQWVMVWDHIVTNEPYFLVFVIVAFNLIQRKALFKCRNEREVCIFFLL